ncbi:hypothetical protein BO85DRAFT_519464 [Aspergillus piperis CBS 112811]|uniref:Myb-like DNA-binding domain-containing protein n=1 Tax=Aspergillus piperis CBS 112811 TaxID=1448313 RepID=A0A8G1R8C4_9EURO|nr:hypothetical protein BO85DRAFT_519464 [Aspergillus piperis CBS 112811]RAH58615.1 hypothetical protein BO85DRAFT_519464 [Aspergillus piperis CBS 112811]
MTKPNPNDTIVFLYMCLLYSDFRVVDWKAFSEATNLNNGAARMRYHRLKKNLDAVIKNGKYDLSIGSATTPTKKHALDMITATDKEGSVEPNSPTIEHSSGVVSIANLLNPASPKRKMADEIDDDSEASTIIDTSFRFMPIYAPVTRSPSSQGQMPAAKKAKKEE